MWGSDTGLTGSRHAACVCSGVRAASWTLKLEVQCGVRTDAKTQRVQAGKVLSVETYAGV